MATTVITVPGQTLDAAPQTVTAPKFYLDRVILENNIDLDSYEDDSVNNTSLSLVVDLLIYSKFSIESNYLKFFEQNNTYLYILEVTNKKWKNLLKQSTELLTKIAKYHQTKESSDVSQYFLQLAINSELIQQGDESAQFFEAAVLASKLTKIPAILGIPIESVSKENVSEIQMYFRRKQKLPNNTSDLSYFIFATSEVIDLQQEIKFSGEIILEDGNLRSTSYTFYDKQDNIWLGDVHLRTNGEWYKGKFTEFKEGETQPLNRVASYNKKIQDFRTLSKLESRIDDRNSMVQVEKLVDNYTIDYKSNLIEKKSINPIKFYDLANPISFKVDLVEIYKTSIIYNLLKRSLQPSTLEMEIKPFRIRGKNVKKGTGFAHATYEMLEPFSKNWQKEYTRYDSEQTENGIIYNIIDLPGANTFYYGVELYYSDPFLEPLREIVEKARLELSNLKVYYSNCTLSDYYDSSINKFTQSFVDWYDSQTTISINSAFRTYVNLIQYLTAPEADPVSVSIAPFLPHTGTPVSIGMLVDSFERVLNIFENIYKKSQKTKIHYAEKIFDNKTQTFLEKVSGKKDIELSGMTNQDLETVSSFYENFGVTIYNELQQNVANNFFSIAWDQENNQQILGKNQNKDFKLIDYTRASTPSGRQQSLQDFYGIVEEPSSTVQKPTIATSNFRQQEIGYSADLRSEEQTNLVILNDKIKEKIVEQASRKSSRRR